MNKFFQTIRQLSTVAMFILVWACGLNKTFAQGSLTITSSPLPAFHLYTATGASYSQWFFFTGTGMTGNTLVTATAPPNFEVSSNNSTFGATATYVSTATAGLSLAGGATTAGSTTITMTSTAGVTVGWGISGGSIPALTKVVSVVNGTTLTISQAPTATASALTFSSGPIVYVRAKSGLAVQNFGSQSYTGGATTSGSATVTMTSTTGIVAGENITGTGIPANTTVLTVVNGTTLTLSANASATGSALTFTVSPNVILSSNNTTPAKSNCSVSMQVYPTPGSFTNGNIAILRMGFTSSIGQVILIDEYTQAGSYVQTFITPFSTSTSYTPNGTSVVESGSAANDGGLSLSADGQYLAYGGYDGYLTQIGIANTTSAVAPRVGALLKADGTFTTNMTTSQFSAASVRGNGAIDGTSTWVGGNGGCYLLTSAGGTNQAGTQIVTGNLRGAIIQNGQLYAMTASAINQLYPATSVAGMSAVPNIAASQTAIPQTGANLFAMCALDINASVPGNDVVYIADGTAGILKYTFDGTSWTAKGSLTGVAGGVTGTVSGGNVTLFITNTTGGGNTVVKYTDNTAATSSLSGTITGNTIVATAFANTVFRGVAMAPRILSATPTVAVATPAPVANNILLGSTNNVIYQMNFTAGANDAVLTGLTITTAGTYNNTTDFVGTNGFKIWISPSSTFSATTATPIGVFAPVASGATISTSILAQSIPASATRYIYFTADVLAGATVGNTINITATPLGNIVLADAGTKTGSAGIGGVKTISPAPSISAVPSTLPSMFTYFGTASGAQSYALTGAYLTANLNVTAPTNFEVSSDGTNFFPSLSLTPVSQSVSATIYVRLTSSAPVGTYTSQLVTNASTGATTQNVTVSGTVVAAATSFTAGDIVVYRIGNGALSSSATATFVDEFQPIASSPLVQSIAMPTGINGSNRMLTNSGTATSEGSMSLSVDGQYLCVGGYDAAVGTATIASTTAASTNRIVGRIGADGSVNTSTRIPDGFDGNNLRSVTSIDGTGFWATGAGNLNTGGVRYITLGNNTSTQLSTAPTNARVIAIYGNQLYVTSATSNVGLNTEGSGVSSSTGLITTTITLPSNPTDAYGYVLLDRDATVPGTDVLYIANNAGGLLKYSFDGTSWTARGSITGNVTAVTGKVNGANADLYVVSANSSTSATQCDLYKVVDVANYDANITGSGGAVSAVPGAVLIKSSATNTVYKGVAFAPVALPTTPVVTFTSGGPAAGPVLQAETDHQIYQLNAAVTGANAVVTSLSFTTGGTYVTGDLFAGPSPFKLRYSTDNVLDATDATIGTAAAVASGGTITFNIAQPIAVSTTGYFFVTVDIAGGATVGNTIRINATPVSNITLADNGTKLGSPAAGGYQTIYSSVLPTVYYSNGGNLDNLANWGDQTDGSVSIPAYAPTGFNMNGITWKIANGSTTINAAWAVSGTNSRVDVQSGQTFIIPAAYSFTITGTGAATDVEATGVLDMINNTIPTLGNLDPASTEIFDGSAQSVPGSLTVSYGNLKLVGGTKTITGLFNSNPIEVKGDFTIDNATLTSNLTGSQEQTIGLWGDLKILNGVTYQAGWNGFVNYEAKGTAAQTFFGNGFAVNCKKFYININNLSAATNLKPSGSVTLSNTGGGTNLVLANTLKVNCGTVSPANTATFDDGGQTITVAGDLEMAGNSANYTLTGSVVLTGASGTVNLRQDGGAGSALVLKANLHNLSIQTSGNTVTQVQPSVGSSTLNITGNFTIAGTSTGKFTPYGNTIKIGGNFSDTRTIDMIAAGTSTFEFNGSSLQTFTTAYTSGESFFSVKINNAAGVNMLSGSIFKNTSTGNLNMTAGILNTGTGKVILNNTATITEPLNGSSFVLGKVETSRTLASGTPETFGGLGIDVTPSANAATTCTRVIGTNNAIGCANSSTLRYFDFTSVPVAAPTSVVYHYFDTNYEMNNYDEGDVSIFTSNSPYTTWTTAPATLDSNNNKLTITGLTTLSRITLSVAAPSGGNAIPSGGTITARTTLICPNSSTNITISGFGQGTVQWQQSSNGVTGWANVVGGSGATSLTYTTPALNATTYYRAIVSNSCFDVSSTTATVYIASPITVTISQVTATSALVSWTPYAANTGVNYTVSWSGAAGSGSASNATNPRLITGLNSSSALNVTVTQNTPAGCLNSSNASTTTLCTAPTGVTQTASTNNSITVSWTGTASSYQVFWKLVNSNSLVYSSATVATSPYTITGLSTGQMYAVYVVGYNCPSIGFSSQPSTTQYFSTNGASITCTVPTVTATSPCPNKIVVTMTGGSGQYYVSLRRTYPIAGTVNTYYVNGNSFTYNINSTPGGSIFEIYARSYCAGVYSQISIPIQVQVKPACPAVSNLVLSNPTCHGFTASWNAEDCLGIGAGYAVYVHNAAGGSTNAYITTATNYKFNIFNLGNTIEVTVRSLGCNSAPGAPSSTESITTLNSCKDEVTGDTMTNDEQSGVTVQTISSQLTVYPNPNMGAFTVNYQSANSDEHTVQVEVFNLLGQTLITNLVEIENGILNQQIELPSEISSGIYFVRVIDGVERMDQKIILQK